LLFAVPMNTGLLPSWSWGKAIAYSAPIITILGAHLNGFLFGRSRFRKLLKVSKPS
jgi:hypothetical protein